VRFSLFLLFFQRIISHRVRILAEILGRRRFSEPKNSQVLAVLSLFSAVLCGRNKRREGGITAGKQFQCRER
jgi:hypothetical protein